ncbi:putative tetratricopeptide-like helical domain-containing protein [Tanacetum coccineum]|uniref:Tetratricopeptide-like helical domain-containing protein n=1 Tax=Tanacetum coccineum TaxID=301880 RepID=A0ABQ5ICV8_9ASTR
MLLRKPPLSVIEFHQLIKMKHYSTALLLFKQINIIGNYGREIEAARMLRDMEEEGVSPGVFTFSILVNAFCKKGCVKDTELAVQPMF